MKVEFNQIYNEDVLVILKALPDESVDMIYADPDYGVGIDYDGSKYTQKWEEYLVWYEELARESMRVLRTRGNAFFINYPRQNAYLRVRCLDGLSYEVQDYVWIYNTNVGHSKRRLTTAHRSVLHATKSKDNKFYKDQIAQPYQNPKDKRILKRMSQGHTGRMPYSWFYFDLVKNVSKDKTFHACQIPAELVRLLINSCTKPGDEVFVLFGGSGGEIMICEELGRSWISAELHRPYFEMIKERLANKGQICENHKLVPRRSEGVLIK